MTNESMQIAAAVDRFPQHIRALLLESTLRVIAVYAATTMEVLERVKPEPLPDNVIPLERRRRGA